MAQENTFLWIAIFAVASAVINGLGIMAVASKKNWAEKTKNYFMCFAAGVLITTPLTVAFPQAVSINHKAGIFALLGFLFMVFSNRFFRKYSHNEDIAFSLTALEGIGIHSIVDGVIYTITFSVSVIIGIMSATGLVVHEFAEGVITYSFLMKGGFEKKKAMFYAFLVSGLTTPLGAFVVYPLMGHVSKSVTGLLLGFVSGVLLYVSASHLLPEAREHEDTHKHSILTFLLGIVFAFLMVMIEGH